jgi:hypothetical protein
MGQKHSRQNIASKHCASESEDDTLASLPVPEVQPERQDYGEDETTGPEPVPEPVKRESVFLFSLLSDCKDNYTTVQPSEAVSMSNVNVFSFCCYDLIARITLLLFNLLKLFR